jgi:Transposase and inactivated derivatives
MKNNHSVTNILIHFVFVTRFRQKFDFTHEITEYMEMLALQYNCISTEINYASDHIHFLCELHPSVCVSEFACKIKSLTSGFIRKAYNLWPGFQRGYGAFSVGKDTLNHIKKYIQDQ